MQKQRRGGRRLGAILATLHRELRLRVPLLAGDAIMAPYIAEAVQLLSTYPIEEWLETTSASGVSSRPPGTVIAVAL